MSLIEIKTPEILQNAPATVLTVNRKLYMFIGGDVERDTRHKQLRIVRPDAVFSLEKSEDQTSTWVEHEKSSGHLFTYDNPVDTDGGVIEAENYDGQPVRAMVNLSPDFLDRSGLIQVEFVPDIEEQLAA